MAAPKATWKTRSFIIALNISLVVASKVALKPVPKFKLVRALKSRAVVKSKPAKITKYKDKTTKLYTSYTYNIKALIIRNR